MQIQASHWPSFSNQLVLVGCDSGSVRTYRSIIIINWTIQSLILAVWVPVTLLFLIKRSWAQPKFSQLFGPLDAISSRRAIVGRRRSQRWGPQPSCCKPSLLGVSLWVLHYLNRSLIIIRIWDPFFRPKLASRFSIFWRGRRAIVGALPFTCAFSCWFSSSSYQPCPLSWQA
jgi:hypothetical protein